MAYPCAPSSETCPPNAVSPANKVKRKNVCFPAPHSVASLTHVAAAGPKQVNERACACLLVALRPAHQCSAVRWHGEKLWTRSRANGAPHHRFGRRLYAGAIWYRLARAFIPSSNTIGDKIGSGTHQQYLATRSTLDSTPMRWKLDASQASAR